VKPWKGLVAILAMLANLLKTLQIKFLTTKKGIITMKNKFLITVSILAIMNAVPAFAETAKSQTQTKPEISETGNIVEDAKTAVKDIKKDTSKAYDKIKATLIGKENNDKNTTLEIDSKYTANNIIGQPVHNSTSKENESVGTIKDIIIDRDGKGIWVIVADGNFFDMGKLAAFDYERIMKINSNGDIAAPLTKSSIDNAAEFSYENKDYSNRVLVIPSNGLSVSKLLQGRLLDQNKESMADIENILFKNGMASQIIVGFDKMLGFGGEKAVFSFHDVTIIHDDEKLDFQMSKDKSAQFETYKKTLTK